MNCSTHLHRQSKIILQHCSLPCVRHPVWAGNSSSFSRSCPPFGILLEGRMDHRSTLSGAGHSRVRSQDSGAARRLKPHERPDSRCYSPTEISLGTLTTRSTASISISISSGCTKSVHRTVRYFSSPALTYCPPVILAINQSFNACQVTSI